jgi:hypothetical protein
MPCLDCGASRSSTLARKFQAGLFAALVLGASAHTEAHPHSLAELLALPFDDLLHLEFSPAADEEAPLVPLSRGWSDGLVLPLPNRAAMLAGEEEDGRARPRETA